ncbi:hypothetical protein H6G91_40515 [Nostoc muscorum FACHB-395]|nr:hypothetical protein [Desmonostoc muscorum FACHB-395]
MDEKWVFTHYLLLITHYSRITVRTLLLTETLREQERQGQTRRGVCQPVP